MAKTSGSQGSPLVRWLLIAFFGLIGASCLTYGFMILVSTNPELNAFSMMFLKKVNVDIHVFVFLLSLVISVLCVVLMVPKKNNNVRSANNQPPSANLQLNEVDSTKMAKKLEGQLNIKEQLRKQREKDDLEQEMKGSSNDKVLPRPE